jgi:hypothetical protein
LEAESPYPLPHDLDDVVQHHLLVLVHGSVVICRPERQVP